jgi:malonate transporter
MQTFVFTLGAVAPVFLIAFLGIFLKRVGLMSEEFVGSSSKFVFRVAMPVLIFQQIATTNVAEAFHPQQVLYATIATLLSFVFVWLVSIPLVPVPPDRGAFIQGAFRSNYAIVGLAIATNLFGEQGAAAGTVLLAFIIPLYNLLSVLALTANVPDGKTFSWKDTLIKTATNPLIVAAILATPFLFLQIPLHPILLKTAGYLSRVALPLALLGIGASLSFQSVRNGSRYALVAAALKLVGLPLLLTTGAYLFGFRGVDLGVMYVLFSSPTAVASFAMADAMGANRRLAGSIVVLSTLGASVTFTIGVTALKSLGVF